METPMLILSVFGPVYLVVGLSLLIYKEEWRRFVGTFVSDIPARRFMGVFPLALGLLIFNTYNVWSKDIYVVVTIIAWAASLKGVFYLLAPASWIKPLGAWFDSDSKLNVWGGLVVIIGAVLTYYVYMV